jgi:XTP/dITP diphosphohydrolase
MTISHRKFQDKKLIIASHNAGKVREIQAMLAPFGIEVVSASSLDLPEPEETGVTFMENAHLKSLASAKAAGLPALADDSGLCVDVLGGDPGIYSARWAEPTKDFSIAMTAIHDAMVKQDPDEANGSAYFICALSLAWPDGHVEGFEGRVDGQICWPPKGEKGFGYDPIFQPNGYDIRFAEMDPDAKHDISHRADAFAKMVAGCFQG